MCRSKYFRKLGPISILECWDIWLSMRLGYWDLPVENYLINCGKQNNVMGQV